MKEYVEKKVIIDHLERAIFGADRKIEKWVNQMPAADVREDVHGEWIVSRTDRGWNGAEFPTHCKCTRCSFEVPYQDKNNFCPYCGAQMDGGDEQ